MSAQMKAVLAIQATRADACHQVGEDAVRAITKPSGTPARFIASRAEYRAERSYWNEGGPTMDRTVDGTISAAGVDVPVRIHYPTAEAVLPGIVFLHGGGFTVGDLDTHDRIMRVLAETSGAAVVGVDYSLSPEVKFPQALHESAGVIDHLVDNGKDFGIDGSRLAVAGDSAGGMLTIGSALLLRDAPEDIGASPESFTAVKALMSFYGGHGLTDSASRRNFGGSWDGMGTYDLDSIMSEYFASTKDTESPFYNHLGADLDGLPPVFVAAAGLDPLRDDGRALAMRLRRAGNDVDYEEYPKVLHSFLHFGRILDDTEDVLTKAARFAADRLT
ncbi:MAG: alpha/beta hydrolase fold domain-containing protein [Brevibacterium aurantiacum]|uniref:Acetylesterase n=1 Tax=Brevibacterium aurantiacum TaxID=273384 RepID=A0A2A3YTF4_BREAU|nr:MULTISPECIES: alpha/beta hydrolase fold domain-containing protein [Brevibacterium]MDN5550662.1 alpha/beta hydrolase fold domain-containing protein [Brevibacterium sp.]AZL10271.1 acetylesterase [Brevibacterium aurantiacum]AZT98285.1 acetylesterase [Brevibacterium aurantiacum]MDN5594267.1 alpha/beta hydrolase fold domain-containing protein [Brevibacterium sp.]MDN5609037.1 alpha/beta hydrolase fold domain-containing protein [Brevibacterium sp.]